MRKILLLLVPALTLAACAGAQSPQDKLTVNDKKIDKIIAQMTLEEKVEMLHSKTNMSSAGVERLGTFRTASSPPAGNWTPPPTSRPDRPSRPPGPRKWPTCTAPAWARKPASVART